VKLYSYFRSSSAWRVRIVLAHKNIPYEYVSVNLAPDVLGQEKSSYLVVNPMRQVPTLEWTEGDAVIRLTQSVAIVEYLEETRPIPPLMPKDPVLRGYVRRAVELVNSGIQPLQNSTTLARVREMGSEADVTQWTESAMARGFEALEAHARTVGRNFSVGDQLSLADVFLVPQLYNARRFGIEVARYPRLLEIEGTLASIPAFTKAHPDVQPDSPRARFGSGKATP
jgi:maleylpyruvate isomerase